MKGLPPEYFDNSLDAETSVVVKCLRAFVAEQPASHEGSGEIDWSRVAELADRHGVSGIVHSQVAGWGDAPPGAAFDELRRRYHGQVAARLIQWSRLTQITSLLAAEQIEVTPLKGVALAERVYARPELRKVGDVDILVRLGDFYRAVAVLESAGYAAPSDLPDPHGKHPFAYHIAMTSREANPASVEVHWLLCDDVYFNNPSSPLDTPSVWERSRESVLLPGARQLSEEDELLYLTGHLAKHGWRMLYGLVDIALFLQRIRVDPVRLDRLLPAFAQDLKFETTLALLRTLLQAPMPEDLNQRLDTCWNTSRRFRRAVEQTVSSILTPQPRRAADRFAPWEKFLSGLRRQASLRRTSAGALRSIAHALTTPDQRDLDLLPLPHWLGWAHRGLRPLRLAALHGRYTGYRLVRRLSAKP